MTTSVGRCGRGGGHASTARRLDGQLGRTRWSAPARGRRRRRTGRSAPTSRTAVPSASRTSSAATMRHTLFVSDAISRTRPVPLTRRSPRPRRPPSSAASRWRGSGRSRCWCSTRAVRVERHPVPLAARAAAARRPSRGPRAPAADGPKNSPRCASSRARRRALVGAGRARPAAGGPLPVRACPSVRSMRRGRPPVGVSDPHSGVARAHWRRPAGRIPSPGSRSAFSINWGTRRWPGWPPRVVADGRAERTQRRDRHPAVELHGVAGRVAAQVGGHPLLRDQQPRPGERAAEPGRVGDPRRRVVRPAGPTRHCARPAVPSGSGSGARQGNRNATGQSRIAARAAAAAPRSSGSAGAPGGATRRRSARGPAAARRRPAGRRRPRPGRAAGGPRPSAASGAIRRPLDGTVRRSAAELDVEHVARPGTPPTVVTTTGSAPRAAGVEGEPRPWPRAGDRDAGQRRAADVDGQRPGRGAAPGAATASSPAAGSVSTDSSRCSPHGSPRECRERVRGEGVAVAVVDRDPGEAEHLQRQHRRQHHGDDRRGRGHPPGQGPVGGPVDVPARAPPHRPGQQRADEPARRPPARSVAIGTPATCGGTVLNVGVNQSHTNGHMLCAGQHERRDDRRHAEAGDAARRGRSRSAAADHDRGGQHQHRGAVPGEVAEVLGPLRRADVIMARASRNPSDQPARRTGGDPGAPSRAGWPAGPRRRAAVSSTGGPTPDRALEAVGLQQGCA